MTNTRKALRKQVRRKEKISCNKLNNIVIFDVSTSNVIENRIYYFENAEYDNEHYTLQDKVFLQNSLQTQDFLATVAGCYTNFSDTPGRVIQYK